MQHLEPAAGGLMFAFIVLLASKKDRSFTFTHEMAREFPLGDFVLDVSDDENGFHFRLIDTTGRNH